MAVKASSTCYSWTGHVFYIRPHCVNCKSNVQIKRNFNIKIIVLQCNDHNQGHPTTSVNQKPILKKIIIIIERAHLTGNYVIFLT